jgi:hypothetical protein
MCYYEIVIKGFVDMRWRGSLRATTIEHLSDGNTRMLCEMKDQSELFATISKIRDMNMILVSIHERPLPDSPVDV